MNEFIKKVKYISQKPAFLKAAVAVGLSAIIFILVSDISDSGQKSNAEDTPIDFAFADVYSEDIKNRLGDILSDIEGVGKVKVMITTGSTEEYVYAETSRKGASQSENGFVILDKGAQKEALVKKVNSPSVSGVLIVCEGGDDPRVCERIYKAVSTALGISTGRIYVAEMK